MAFRLKQSVDKIDGDDIRNFRKSAYLKAKKQVKSKNMNKFIERDFLQDELVLFSKDVYSITIACNMTTQSPAHQNFCLK